MGHRHNILNDRTFSHSKYIHYIEKEFGYKNFKKEEKKQYTIMQYRCFSGRQ